MAKKKDIANFFDTRQKKLLKGLRTQVNGLNELLGLIAASQNVDSVNRDHLEFLGTIGSRTLDAKELEMAKSGIPLDELRKICGRKMLAAEHVYSLRETLPQGHVLQMVYAEHDLVLYYLANLESINTLVQQATGWAGNKKLLDKIVHIIQHLCEMDAHQVREERIIFPQLAAHGYDEVPKDCCAEHDKMHKARVEIKMLADAIEKMDFSQWKERLDEALGSFVPATREHIYKEETILFPTAVKVVQDPRVWEEMKAACDEIGICCF
ncbi:MAG: hemerythrin domain-containing protein [Sedimentisphaerales bacterium]|nr:hemerythrin domain-containing protein [Sedimentisphaerales bacterium]